MKWPPKTMKIAAVDNPTVVWRPVPEEPQRISAYALYFHKMESFTYILLLIAWVYLHWNVCGWPPEDASFLEQSAYRLFKVIQGQWFWYSSKARMRLPICPLLLSWFCLAPFLIYGDLLAKNWVFFLPISRFFPFGISWRNYDRSSSCFWHSASGWRTDGQTDRRTDGFTIATRSTALCIASYADAL